MTAHHLIVSDILKQKCMYCGTEFDPLGWKSDHVLEKHYKINKCKDCGKEGKIGVDFDGDGADSWAMPIEKQLKAIAKIREIIGENGRSKELKEVKPWKELEKRLK